MELACVLSAACCKEALSEALVLPSPASPPALERSAPLN